jgi:hypothetical protein
MCSGTKTTSKRMPSAQAGAIEAGAIQRMIAPDHHPEREYQGRLGRGVAIDREPQHAIQQGDDDEPGDHPGEKSTDRSFHGAALLLV